MKARERERASERERMPQIMGEKERHTEKDE